jgi:hypothetical protein
VAAAEVGVQPATAFTWYLPSIVQVSLEATTPAGRHPLKEIFWPTTTEAGCAVPFAHTVPLATGPNMIVGAGGVGSPCT